MLVNKFIIFCSFFDLSTEKMGNLSIHPYRMINSFFLYLCGFDDGVFPRVFLLSRWQLSGSPIDMAVLFEPGSIISPFLLLTIIFYQIFANLFVRRASFIPIQLTIIQKRR
jgi:hypothetical protein